MAKTKGAKKIQWNDVRSDIQRMYVYEGMKLEDVRSRLKASKNFDASTRSYRSKINEWGLKKGSVSQTNTRRNASVITPSAMIESSGPSTLASSLSGKRSEITSNGHSSGMLNTTFDPETWTMASNLQPVPGSGTPNWFHSLPCEALWQAIDCIEHKNVAGLRMVLDFTIANEAVPSLGAYPELSRFQKLYGSPLLHLAVAASSVEVVKTLLDAGADINTPAQTLPHHTPLMAAVARSATSIVELLLVRGASTEPTDAKGHQALSIAAHCAQDPRIVELLLQDISPLRWCDRLSALDPALSRRKREYGSPDHANSTCVARMLLTVDRTTPAYSRIFLEPWTEHPDWVSLINKDEKKSLVHLIGWGLDLNQPCAPPHVHSGANLAHTLLFHCWDADMPVFLSRNLRSSSAVSEELLRTLAGSCAWKCFQGARNAEAMSAFLENGVEPESQHEQLRYTPLFSWIRSLEYCSIRTKIESALPSLEVLLKNGANPNHKVETYPLENLLKQKWVHKFPDIAIKVVEMLLSRPPDDTDPIPPPWYISPYFPITKDFEKHELEGKDLDKFRGKTENRLSANSRDLLFRAAYIMSMKKFLASQDPKDKSSRAYDKILPVLKQLADFGIPFDNITMDFIHDTIRFSALSSRQAPGPGDWTDASESAFLQPVGAENLSPEQRKIANVLLWSPGSTESPPETACGIP